MNPRSLSTLPGAYQVSSGNVIAITRSGNELFMMQTGSALGRQRLYPLSADRFLIRKTSSRNFATAETEIAFTTGPDGKAPGLDLFVNGLRLPGHAVRLSAGTGQGAIQKLQALAARVEQQTPVPNGPDVLRRLIDRMADGHPEQMQVSPELSSVLQFDRIPNQRIMTSHGPIESIKYEETAPDGVDLYRVGFSRGAAFFGILLGDDGVIEKLDLRLN
jgi:hypothetical protein